MLYDIDRRLRNLRKRIGNLEEEDNSEVILKFLEKLFSEGLAKATIIKNGENLYIASKMMGKSFLKTDKEDIITYLSKLEQSDYSVYVKSDHKLSIKRLFSYLEKEELVKDIITTVKKSRKKLPDELLTEDDIEKMIKAANSYRDKALIGVLYEAGIRVGELASLKIKNVQFDEMGSIIKVRGKTGERRIRIVMFASLLAKWFEVHPRRDNKEALLWVNLSTNYKKEGLTYQAIRANLIKIAERAGIKKKITPHLFRHSRATHLAKDLTEAEMNVYFGWVQGSDMPATYVHLSGRDVDDKILQLHNLKPKDKDREDALRAKKCPRCQYICSPTDSYCGRCGTVLNEGERVKLEMKSRQLIKDLPELAAADPGFLQDMKKFLEVIELFEKRPELFSTLKAAVEETI